MDAYHRLTAEQAAWLKTLATDLYHANGHYLTPVRMGRTAEGRKDPRPLMPYTGWREIEQTRDEIASWFTDPALHFNALLARSVDMLVVDTDSPATTEAFAKGIAVDALPPTDWVATTGRGHHYYYTNPDRLVSRSGPGIDVQTTCSRVGETNGKGVFVAGSWHPVRERCYELVDLGRDVKPGVFRAGHMWMLERAGMIAEEVPHTPSTYAPRPGDGDPERYRGLLALPPPQDEPTFFRVATSLLTMFSEAEVLAWAATGAKYDAVQDARKIAGWAGNAGSRPISIGTAIGHYGDRGLYDQRAQDAHRIMKGNSSWPRNR